MISGLTSLQQFYRGHRINIFKDCYTVAGAARILLFRTAREQGACFALMRKDERYLQEKILEARVIGGPSIVFCRYQEAGVTHLLQGNKGPLCKAIHGLDANRLRMVYEYTIGYYILWMSYHSSLCILLFVVACI